MPALPRRQFIGYGAKLAATFWLSPVVTAWAANAPPILLANILGTDVDPASYLVSEKNDSVRARWDGKILRFRSGREVAAPRWFIDKLPPQALDGELWLARGKFEDLPGIVRKTEPVDGEWRQIKYMIFELPGAPGRFAERAQNIRDIVAAATWPQLVAVDQFKVADRVKLKRKLDEVVRGGAIHPRSARPLPIPTEA
jgi:DNA ligase-1